MNRDESLLDLADVLRQLGNELRRAGDIEDPIISWYGGQAADFYATLGFKPSPTDPLHLYLLLSDARASLGD